MRLVRHSHWPFAFFEGVSLRKSQHVACRVALAVVFAANLCTAQAQRPSVRDQVIATERAFAKTMADRNKAAFDTFISPEAVFFNADKAQRGKPVITQAWAKYFDKPQAPFSWEPQTVEVLDSGTLALSSGPVRDPSGKLIGTFTSIWRLEGKNTWRIIFDKGNDVCGP